MTERKFYTYVIYEVGDIGESPLIVKPHGDSPEDWVQLTTRDEEYWGNIDITLPKDMAIRLGGALIKCAEQLGEEK